MPTPGKHHGALWKLLNGGAELEGIMVSGLSLTKNTADATTKDSTGLWEEHIETTKSGEFTFEGKVQLDATQGWEELYDAFVGTAGSTIRKTTSVTGDRYYEASCTVTSLSIDAQLGDATSFSGTLKINGAITTGTET